jgi:DNA mismatch endonuclease, patch repair protein
MGRAVRKWDGMTQLPYPVPRYTAVSAAMRGNRSRDTGRQTPLAHARSRFPFRVDYLIQAAGTCVRTDLAFPRRRFAVFVDGCFWHSCSEHGNAPPVNTRYWRLNAYR